MAKSPSTYRSKVFRYFFLLLLLAFFIYAWLFMPIISGYVAKEMCSGIFISNRTVNDISQNETGIFPYKLISCNIDLKDSSVSTSFLGLARRKAIYRAGLGVTLVSGLDESEIRKQSFAINAVQPASPDSVNFPVGNHINNTSLPGVDQRQLDSALSYAFNEPAGNAVRRTRAVVIVYNGQIIGERYASGYSVNTKLLGWSMTKSIINALIGILVNQGKLDVSAPAPIDEWKKDDRARITTANLMYMNSGLSFFRFAGGPSDVTNMLFKEPDMSSFAINKKSKYSPGEVFNYSDGSANILSYIIRKKVGDREYYRFPYIQLFHRIGMYNTVMEVDPSGTFVGSSYCYATARDWARFGLLYLNDGVLDGERILPEGWVKFSATPSAAKNSSKGGKYGALWWSNAGEDGFGKNRRYPNVPADCFSAQGFDGQYLLVIPSKKLVVVRLAFERGNELEPDIFLSSVLRALPEPQN